MNYGKGFKRFTAELLDLVERHIQEWYEAEKEIRDVDDIERRIMCGSDKPTEPVDYFQNTKKFAKRKEDR